MTTGNLSIVPVSLMPLSSWMVEQFIPAIYEMLPTAQQAEIEAVQDQLDAKKKTAKKRLLKLIDGRMAKQARLVPSLIFQIELFERAILVANKRLGVQLAKKFYRSTARDFKIQMDLLEVDDDCGSSSPAGSNTDEDSPSKSSDAPCPLQNSTGINTLSLVLSNPIDC